jgi:predicted DNA-binding transcriptional regulator AlpA
MHVPPSPLQAVTMAYVARRLGIHERTEATQRRHILDLVANHAFPSSLPGRLGCRSLRWDRRAVDAWFDGLLPPQLQDHFESSAAALTLADLAARAEAIAA